MSRQVKVYRYEHKDTGEGPYQIETLGDFGFELACAHNGKQHPDIFDDVKANITNINKYVCGCSNKQKLLAWFDGWHDKLQSNGYIIKEYLVDIKNVLQTKSRKQIAFIKE